MTNRMHLRGYFISAGITIGVFISPWTVQASTTAPAPQVRTAEDRSVASTYLQMTKQSENSCPVVKHVRKKLIESLQRADQALAAGDTTNAAYLEGLAREWAELGSDLRRAIQSERQATQSQNAVVEKSKKVKKSRAMIDALASQHARTQAQLQQLYADSQTNIPEPALKAAQSRTNTHSNKSSNKLGKTPSSRASQSIEQAITKPSQTTSPTTSPKSVPQKP